MSIKVLFAAPNRLWPAYAAPLAEAARAAGLDADFTCEAGDPARFDHVIFAPGGAIEDFTPFTRCKAVLSLWAGVERIVSNPTLTQPLCRMVDPAMTQGMVEYVTGHVLRHHLGMDLYLHGQDGIWRNDTAPPIAPDRPVTILGLGELGTACARSLTSLGFPVTGWSRSPRLVEGVTCLSGPEGLRAALAGAQIVVTLLPRTAETENILNAETLALLPQGAVIINPGRGHLIDEAALIAALDRGHIAHATLDVFRSEPLPPDHPFWAHPRVTVTPHIAAETRPASAARVVVENIRRAAAGEPLLYLVDRARGY